MNSRLEQLQDPSVAAKVLGEHLRNGQLALFLGAGVSRGLGLPGWGELVCGCEKAAGLPEGLVDDSSEAYMRRMDSVRRAFGGDSDGFLATVRSGLYGQALLATATYPKRIVNLPMLSALGALVMTSSRGSIGDVFTLNFDDVLDWYLHLHGFRSQSVSELPCLIDGAVDVRIYHLHGYLPLNPIHEGSKSIILSRQSFVERITEDASHPWPSIILSSLLSKVLLIVGTSLGDIDIAQMIERARRAVGGERPLAFAVGANFTHDQTAALMESTIVPISLGDHDLIPDFLLGLCQIAADAR